MASPKLPNYLRTHRKRLGLSQEEVAYLLGCRNGTKVSRYERHARLPKLHTIFATEVIFGAPVRELFAGLYNEAEQRTRERARGLILRLEKFPSSPAVSRKLQILRSIERLGYQHRKGQ